MTVVPIPLSHINYILFMRAFPRSGAPFLISTVFREVAFLLTYLRPIDFIIKTAHEQNAFFDDVNSERRSAQSRQAGAHRCLIIKADKYANLLTCASGGKRSNAWTAAKTRSVTSAWVISLGCPSGACLCRHVLSFIDVYALPRCKVKSENTPGGVHRITNFFYLNVPIHCF